MINEPYELRKLTELNPQLDLENQFEILMLPENFGQDNQEKIYDAQDGIQLSKLCKNAGIKCANSFDLKLNSPTIERRSDDIWFGEIFIIKDAILPLFVSVISGVLTTLILHKKSKKDKRTPTGEVHIQITIKKHDDYSRFEYDGDAELLAKILEGMIDNKSKDEL